MNAQQLLQEISDYCRRTGLAESTFGRRAVNDGKLTARLRNGGRITTDTLDRIHGFMAAHPAQSDRPAIIERVREGRTGSPSPPPAPPKVGDPQRNFRFFDNRQKYLLFVNTCSEKWEVAHRVSEELTHIHPRPPAVRVFDAGVGDGTVLVRVMRAMHDRFPHMPFYMVGKEISLEDVRLTLQKMSDRFFEHPATVLVLTNLAYADAPWLAVKSINAASSLVWHELPLLGNSAHQFEKQIVSLEQFLGENWKATVSTRTGNPIYERPVVLVLYREDHRFLLDPIIPRPGGTQANYDLVIASQPYRARAARIQGQARDCAAGTGARTRRTACRHSFPRSRSGDGNHPKGLARRSSVHSRPAPDPQSSKARTGPGRARPQLQRLCRQSRAVPLCDAHAAVGNFRLDRHLYPVRGVERRNLCSTSGG